MVITHKMHTKNRKNKQTLSVFHLKVYSAALSLPTWMSTQSLTQGWSGRCSDMRHMTPLQKWSIRIQFLFCLDEEQSDVLHPRLRTDDAAFEFQISNFVSTYM